MIDKAQLGRRIRALRTNKKFTQDKLAEYAGLNGKYLGEVERGNATISLENLNKISEALAMPLLDLLNAEHEIPQKDMKEEVTKMLDEANDEQLKTIYRILTAVVR